ncbi:MAG: GNAT family N-acetyltransferase [Clostridiales bacterium]|nr:GNAT family N-acetyltransferase [Clostridiales bacterium]
MQYNICPINAATRQLITAFIDGHWFGTDMLIRGEIIDMTAVDGFALLENGELTGVITYILRGDACEVTSLDSTDEGRGVGSALVNSVVLRARELGCRRLQLLTTNDNLNAIGFYQKRGFELVGVNLGAIDREREQKPTIPLIGMNGIPLHHEIEFAMAL